MMTRYQVWLNGRALHTLAPSICILDVHELPPVMELRTEDRAADHGRLLTESLRRSLSVRIAFAIREIVPALRSQVLASVMAWVRDGGTLTVNTRPGVQLLVHPTALPVCASVDDWTETLTMELTAYEQPFWQACIPAAVTLREHGAASLYVPGNASRAICDVEVTNTGGAACNTLSVTARESCFRFAELALMPGETLRCTHDAKARLVIMIQAADGTERSAYHLRTADSHDELLLPCGTSSPVAVTAEGSVKAVLKARGCWL